MSKTVACVLKSGGDYDVEYVERLQRGVAEYLPGARFVCLSDVEVPCERIPLEYDWSGWWSKMELCRPDIKGDLLYLDLDTIVTGDLKPLFGIRHLAMLSDFYHPERLASGVMLLPEKAREWAWNHWTNGPEEHIERVGRYGDQMVFAEAFEPHVVRIQDAVPGKVVSYKVHCRNGVPEGASLVCFHGKPRPRDVNWLEPVVEQD